MFCFSCINHDIRVFADKKNHDAKVLVIGIFLLSLLTSSRLTFVKEFFYLHNLCGYDDAYILLYLAKSLFIFAVAKLVF